MIFFFPEKEKCFIKTYMFNVEGFRCPSQSQAQTKNYFCIFSEDISFFELCFLIKITTMLKEKQVDSVGRLDMMAEKQWGRSIDLLSQRFLSSTDLAKLALRLQKRLTPKKNMTDSKFIRMFGLSFSQFSDKNNLKLKDDQIIKTMEQRVSRRLSHAWNLDLTRNEKQAFMSFKSFTKKIIPNISTQKFEQISELIEDSEKLLSLYSNHENYIFSDEKREYNAVEIFLIFKVRQKVQELKKFNQKLIKDQNQETTLVFKKSSPEKFTNIEVNSEKQLEIMNQHFNHANCGNNWCPWCQENQILQLEGFQQNRFQTD